MELVMLWDLLTFVLLTLGTVFILIGGVGVLRMPDVYTRLHAAGITDTMGAGLILVGLMFQGGWSLVTVKLMLILLFLEFTSPTSTHALAKAALFDVDNPKPILHKGPPL